MMSLTNEDLGSDLGIKEEHVDKLITLEPCNYLDFHCNIPVIEDECKVNTVKDERLSLEDFTEEVGKEKTHQKDYQWEIPSIEDYHFDLFYDEPSSLVFDELKTTLESEFNLADEFVTGIQIVNTDNTPKTTFNRVYSSGKPYECVVCKKNFTKKSALEQHAVVHTGEKPYSCVICKTAFNRKNTLKRHAFIHTKEKPYTCDVCQMRFCRKFTLTRHTRTHTGEKPYTCDVCRKGFGCKFTLTRHTRIHTGEKPYTCDFCQKGFGSNYILVRHTSIHAPKKP